MRVVARVAVLLVAVLMLAGCLSSGAQRREIIVTTNILGDLTRVIVGDAAEVTVLMQPDTDPHFFAISARQAAQLERAGLIVHNGLGLEEGVQRHVDAAAHAGVATVAVGDRVDPLVYRPEVGADRPDPHFWTDPRRVRRAVEVIRDEVVAHVAGIDAAAIRERAERYLGDLDRLDRWMTERFAAIPAERRKLVTNHHVFGYLAQRYGFQVIGAVIPGGTTLASPPPRIWPGSPKPFGQRASARSSPTPPSRTASRAYSPNRPGSTSGSFRCTRNRSPDRAAAPRPTWR